MEPVDAIAAVTHPDPYPYYASLVERSPFFYDRVLGAWVASSAEAVEQVFRCPEARVRPPSEPLPQVLAAFARFTDGERHDELRAATLARIAPLASGAADPVRIHSAAELDDFIERFPVHAAGLLLGIRPESLRDVFPPEPERMFEAVRQLEPNRPFDAVATDAAVLFQSADATRGLIGNTLLRLLRMPHLRTSVPESSQAIEAIVEEVARIDSPVANTRRFASTDTIVRGERLRAGETILLVIAAANRDPAGNSRCYTFGSGAHECPGKRLAIGIAAAGVRALLESGVLDLDLPLAVRYRPSINVRIPLFASHACSREPDGVRS